MVAAQQQSHQFSSVEFSFNSIHPNQEICNFSVFLTFWIREKKWTFAMRFAHMATESKNILFQCDWILFRHSYWKAIQLLNKWFPKVPQTGIWIDDDIHTSRSWFTHRCRKNGTNVWRIFHAWWSFFQFVYVGGGKGASHSKWLSVPQLVTIGSTLSWKNG